MDSMWNILYITAMLRKLEYVTPFSRPSDGLSIKIKRKSKLLSWLQNAYDRVPGCLSDLPSPIPRGHCPSLNAAFLAFAWTPQACCFWALCPESVLLIFLFIQGSAPTSPPQGGFFLSSSFFIPLPHFIFLHDAAPSASKASFVCLLLFHQFEINFYKEGDVGNIPHRYP